MTLTAYLATRQDRCPHGFHLRSQGCTDCGQRLKFRGQSIATAAHTADRAKVEAAVRQLAARGVPFSANDARALHGVRGGVVGATFTALREAKVIRRAEGYVTSTDPGTHAHPIALWIGAAA